MKTRLFGSLMSFLMCSNMFNSQSPLPTVNVKPKPKQLPINSAKIIEQAESKRARKNAKRYRDSLKK